MEQCKHGWTRATLESARVECQRIVDAHLADTTHPFRNAGLLGARACVASVDSHLAEIARGEPLQSTRRAQ